MIVAKTKLRKIPGKCLKCKFCVDTGKLGTSYYKEFWDCFRRHKCFLTGAEVPFEYNTSKKEFEFTKCKSCPLKEEYIKEG